MQHKDRFFFSPLQKNDKQTNGNGEGQVPVNVFTSVRLFYRFQSDVSCFLLLLSHFIHLLKSIKNNN